MNVVDAYTVWSELYDTNENKTRDLESISLIASLSEISFSSVLEIGCGTGKNTVWMQTKAKRIFAIDITESMIA
jgi:ubiquinone/menaquinone biosynthesis C-methylase UbiE